MSLDILIAALLFLGITSFISGAAMVFLAIRKTRKDEYMGYEIWESEDQWYWHLRDANNQIVADGSEGYDDKDNVKRAIANVQQEAQSDVVIEIDEVPGAVIVEVSKDVTEMPEAEDNSQPEPDTSSEAPASEPSSGDLTASDAPNEGETPERP